jgi:hypothetical protein
VEGLISNHFLLCPSIKTIHATPHPIIDRQSIRIPIAHTTGERALILMPPSLLLPTIRSLLEAINLLRENRQADRTIMLASSRRKETVHRLRSVAVVLESADGGALLMTHSSLILLWDVQSVHVGGAAVSVQSGLLRLQNLLLLLLQLSD